MNAAKKGVGGDLRFSTDRHGEFQSAEKKILSALEYPGALL
jgi:hypothetical protein